MNAPAKDKPLWATVDCTANGATRRLGAASAQTAKHALLVVVNFVMRSGALKATDTRVEIRPSGVTDGETPIAPLRIEGVHQCLGLDHLQRKQVQAALGTGPLAPRLDIEITFAPAGAPADG